MVPGGMTRKAERTFSGHLAHGGSTREPHGRRIDGMDSCIIILWRVCTYDVTTFL